MPTAAPTRRLPTLSLQAFGNSVAFWKSLTVIMPLQFMIAGNHQHLLDAVLVQQRQHLVLGCILAHRDQALFRRHDRGDRRVELGLEAQIAMRDDADDLGAEHHRHAGDVLGARQLQHLADGHVRIAR